MVKHTGRGLVVKRPGFLSKVQMLNLVLGVGVFSLLPNLGVRGGAGRGIPAVLAMSWYSRGPGAGVGGGVLVSEPPVWGHRKGVTPICSVCSDFPVFFRFAFLVFWNTPICSDLLRFVPICFQNKSEEIRETPFCRPLVQIPDGVPVVLGSAALPVVPVVLGSTALPVGIPRPRPLV